MINLLKLNGKMQLNVNKYQITSAVNIQRGKSLQKRGEQLENKRGGKKLERS